MPKVKLTPVQTSGSVVDHTEVAAEDELELHTSGVSTDSAANATTSCTLAENLDDGVAAVLEDIDEPMPNPDSAKEEKPPVRL